VQIQTHKGVLASCVLVGGLALAACGSSQAAHVVQSSPTAVAPGSHSSAAAPGSPGATRIPGQPATPGASGGSGSASEPLNTQTLDQVSTELNQLDNSLNAATSDLNNTQGDS
jgi:hypothetical protein